MKTNSVYLARLSKSKLLDENRKWESILLNKELDNKTLYVIDESKIDAYKMHLLSKLPEFKKIDNFFVLAP
jgi:hypothetical protein